MTTELLTRETLGERQGGGWSCISSSRLNLWAKCPLAFRFLCSAPHKNRYVVFRVMWR